VLLKPVALGQYLADGRRAEGQYLGREARVVLTFADLGHPSSLRFALTQA
jgi:hypothetical protein